MSASLDGPTDKNGFQSLHAGVTHFFVANNTGTDEGVDDPICAGRLRIDLMIAEGISGVWPLHASIEGERSFRSIAEFDTLIADLQELRAEWVNLITDGGERA